MFNCLSRCCLFCFFGCPLLFHSQFLYFSFSIFFDLSTLLFSPLLLFFSFSVVSVPSDKLVVMSIMSVVQEPRRSCQCEWFCTLLFFLSFFLSIFFSFCVFVHFPFGFVRFLLLSLPPPFPSILRNIRQTRLSSS